MSCPTITSIDRSEYIGNSLQTINNNFSNLKDGICDNNTEIISLQQDIQNLDTHIEILSSVTSHSVPKAFVKFSGVQDVNNNNTGGNPNRYILHSYNISSVYRKNTGDYRIYFNTPLSTGNYLVLATNSEKLNSNSEYVWSQPYSTTKEYLEIKLQSCTGVTADPNFVSIVAI
jgi:hypothetical protein